MKRISLKDIAKEAGVSVTTVSLVINDKTEKGRISKAVVDRVNEVIKLNSYQPNTIARSLRTGKTGTIGLIVEDVSNHFFGSISKTIELVAYENGYKVITASTDNDDKKSLELIEMMKLQQVEGLIVTPTIGSKFAIQELLNQQKPLVLFDRFFPDLETSYVVLDNFKGSLDMTNYLLKKGYKHIAFITIQSSMNQMQNRLEGYKHALKLHTKSDKNNYVLEFPYESTKLEKFKLLSKFLKTYPKIDALFFGTNYLGIIGIDYITSKNLLVPKDYGFVSFDDHDLFKFLNPSITVVAQPIELLANEAINTLLTLMKSSPNELIKKSLLPKIIARTSE